VRQNQNAVIRALGNIPSLRKNINKERRQVQEQGIRLDRVSGLAISEQQWQVFF
jgi:predicted N-acyltransferase